MYWVKELRLKNREKDMLSTGEWLSDAHMEAANKVLKEQHLKQNGLQDTLVLAQIQSNQFRTDYQHFK